MATTFKIIDGDVVVNTSTGRPALIGNDINENVAYKAKEKATQDIKGGLSINRINSGAGAGINELIGIMQQVGFTSTKTIPGRAKAGQIT